MDSGMSYMLPLLRKLLLKLKSNTNKMTMNILNISKVLGHILVVLALLNPEDLKIF